MKILRGAPKICILQNLQEGGGGGGAPKKLNCYRGGLLKFQASSFNIFIPPLVISNELSLKLVIISLKAKTGYVGVEVGATPFMGGI